MVKVEVVYFSMPFGSDFIEYFFVSDNINRFRRDFKEAVNSNLDLSENSSAKDKLVTQIKEAPRAAKASHTKKGVLVGLIGGILSWVLPNYGYTGLGFWIFLLTTLMVLEIPLRIAIIHFSAYKSADISMGKEELVFRRAWNRGIMGNVVSLSTLLGVALLLRYREPAYEVAIGKVEAWLPLLVKRMN